VRRVRRSAAAGSRPGRRGTHAPARPCCRRCCRARALATPARLDHPIDGRPCGHPPHKTARWPRRGAAPGPCLRASCEPCLDYTDRSVHSQGDQTDLSVQARHLMRSKTAFAAPDIDHRVLHRRVGGSDAAVRRVSGGVGLHADHHDRRVRGLRDRGAGGAARARLPLRPRRPPAGAAGRRRAAGRGDDGVRHRAWASAR